jgi:hypothetical protein
MPKEQGDAKMAFGTKYLLLRGHEAREQCDSETLASHSPM